MTTTDTPADAEADTCTSTFIVPGETRVRRCGGRRDHRGIMHGGDGAAWGEGAAADQHPAEPLVIRTGEIAGALAESFALLTVIRRLHVDAGGRCPECARVWPCRTASLFLDLIGETP